MLLPILAFIFMFGWLIYSAGQTQASRKAPAKNKKAHRAENDLEIGLIAEIAEEPQILQ